jgi:hypothetical protein
MLRVFAIFSLGIIGAGTLFVSGAWLSDSRKGSVIGLVVAVFCILAVLALSGCAVVDACRQGLCR